MNPAPGGPVTDFAIAAADAVETYRLSHRSGADRLRGVARLYDDYVQLAVAPGSGIRSVADLRGTAIFGRCEDCSLKGSTTES
ncbi:hypothetical protein SGRIM128S_04118 [Streptomyces griseomycini]